ncbi:MAG TPA: hypothetical protein VFC93_15515 [Chloroflexota bacterium]|nr:hypothetical protein [Chloroflexota bacterium]
MIEILAVVAALSLFGSIGWAIVLGGFHPPTDPASVRGPPQATGFVGSTALAPTEP